MSKFETIEEVKSRVSREELYFYYVELAHNQNDTRQHFNISRPNLYKLLKIYNIKKTPSQIAETGKNTNISLYGVSNYNNREQYFDTILAKYGSIENAYSNFNEKSKITKLQRYGDAGYTNREKAKQTMFERTGYYYGHQSKESVEKSQKTYFDRTGYINPSFNPEIKDKISQKLKNKSPEEKETIKRKKQLFWENLSDEERYKIHLNRSEAAKQFHMNLDDDKRIIRSKKLSTYRKCKWSEMSEFDKEILREKRLKSMRERGTFNSSVVEDRIFELLIDKFGEVIRQYRDERYPFNCDFYIPSKDLFIELNAHWTHGGMPYDPNNEVCKEQLRRWEEKSKNSKYYKNAIYAWTNLDVRKQKCAKENELNYKVIYNIKNFNIEEI